MRVVQTLIPLEKLNDLLPTLRTEYADALPFPHTALDDFLDKEVAEAILKEFPGENDIRWKNYYDQNQKKQANENEEFMGPLTRKLLHALNSAEFLKFLEEMTGIQNLIADPGFRGGGLHNIYRGGKLGIHADFNKHESLNLDRRLNLLLYLNKNWKEEYGGHIELWDKDMNHCVIKHAPLFNRAVVFTTTDTSYHGHPDPLNCPADMSRKSLALYYYTDGRPGEEVGQFHSTLFKDRPNEPKENSLMLKIGKYLRKLKNR
jgi:Rps23 Pro-64 3,4-dihydroxylase Tpa1-like proline 4-hydroxylase